MLGTRLVATALSGLILAVCGSAVAFTPGENVECIAPAGPGGGWDFTCRSIGKILYEQEYVPEPVQVTNMPGGGGGVAYGYTVSKRNGDPDLLVAASTATTTRLAQGQYADLSEDQVRWVASMGADFGALMVTPDSPYGDLQDFVDAVKSDPSQVAIGGASAVGGWDHIKVMLILREAGMEDLSRIKYISFNNAGDSMSQLLGGHIDVLVGDASEVLGQLEAGKVRGLAVLGDERLEGTASVIPTAKEKGYDVVAANWRGFYMPGGVSEEAYNYWVEAMEEIYKTDAWKKAMAQNALAPFWKGGREFNDFVNQQIKDLRALSREIGML